MYPETATFYTFAAETEIRSTLAVSANIWFRPKAAVPLSMKLRLQWLLR